MKSKHSPVTRRLLLLIVFGWSGSQQTAHAAWGFGGSSTPAPPAGDPVDSPVLVPAGQQASTSDRPGVAGIDPVVVPEPPADSEQPVVIPDEPAAEEAAEPWDFMTDDPRDVASQPDSDTEDISGGSAAAQEVDPDPMVARWGPADPPAPGFFAGDGDPNALLDWLRAHGGTAHFEVAQVCPGCIRGTLATKDFERGDLVAHVPGKLVIDVGLRTEDLSVAAARLAKRMHADPSFNATFTPYLDTLPNIEEVLAPEMWGPQLLAATQNDETAGIVWGRVLAANDAWKAAGLDGRGKDHNVSMPLGTFKHLVATIVSRMYGYALPSDENKEHLLLVPIFDMANCADRGLEGADDEGSNAEVQMPAVDNSFDMIAKRPIKKGEEVTNNYGWNYLHRPDLALLVYGFVPRREPPIMSTVDLPAGFGDVVHPQDGYPITPVHEPDYGNPAGNWTNEQELQRLTGIYAGLPTTLEQDVAALAGEADWQLQTLLQWRVARKRALLAAITQLSATLAAHHKVWPYNPNFRPAAPGGSEHPQPLDSGSEGSKQSSQPVAPPPEIIPDGGDASDGGIAPKEVGQSGQRDEL